MNLTRFCSGTATYVWYSFGELSSSIEHRNMRHVYDNVLVWKCDGRYELSSNLTDSPHDDTQEKEASSGARGGRRHDRKQTANDSRRGKGKVLHVPLFMGINAISPTLKVEVSAHYQQLMVDTLPNSVERRLSVLSRGIPPPPCGSKQCLLGSTPTWLTRTPSLYIQRAAVLSAFQPLMTCVILLSSLQGPSTLRMGGTSPAAQPHPKTGKTDVPSHQAEEPAEPVKEEAGAEEAAAVVEEKRGTSKNAPMAGRHAPLGIVWPRVCLA